MTGTKFPEMTISPNPPASFNLGAFQKTILLSSNFNPFCRLLEVHQSIFFFVIEKEYYKFQSVLMVFHPLFLSV